jgi:rSAM/selenodomain-associated transferase 2
VISVIVPTLNEESTIAAICSNLACYSTDLEIIIADGGSSDKTIAIAKSLSRTKVVSSKRGRGEQMNAGALQARGDILLFLHADSYVLRDALHLVEETMKDNSIYAGSFCLAFDHYSPLLALYSNASRINHILFTYGDQGLFLRKSDFDAVGGYKNIPLMEDVEIQQRIRRQGKFKKLDVPVYTSARRYLSNGILKQQIVNTALVLSYHFGIPAHWLKCVYSDDKAQLPDESSQTYGSPAQLQVLRTVTLLKCGLKHDKA